MRKDELFEILTDWNFWAKEIDTGILRAKYLNKLIELITETNQINLRNSKKHRGRYILRMSDYQMP